MIGKKKIPNYYLFKDLSLNEIKIPLKDKYKFKIIKLILFHDSNIKISYFYIFNLLINKQRNKKD